MFWQKNTQKYVRCLHQYLDTHKNVSGVMKYDGVDSDNSSGLAN